MFIKAVKEGVHRTGREGDSSLGFGGAYIDISSLRGPGMEASYESHLDKYPLGLGVPSGLLTTISDWQSKYTGVDPIEKVAFEGKLLADDTPQFFTKWIFPGPVIHSVVRPAWDKYILRR